MGADANAMAAKARPDRHWGGIGPLLCGQDKTRTGPDETAAVPAVWAACSWSHGTGQSSQTHPSRRPLFSTWTAACPQSTHHTGHHPIHPFTQASPNSQRGTAAPARWSAHRRGNRQAARRHYNTTHPLLALSFAFGMAKIGIPSRLVLPAVSAMSQLARRNPRC